MKVKNIVFSGFAAAILMGVAADANAATEIATKAYVDRLDDSFTVDAGKYVSGVTQSDGAVSVTTANLATEIAENVMIAPTTDAVYNYVTEANNLDTLNSTATIADGEYVSSVVQSNGVVNVSKANLSTTITAGDMKAPTTDAVNTAIQGVTSELDGSFTVDAGKYVSAVTQADGAVTVTTAALAAEIAEGELRAPTTDAVYQETKNIPDPDDCQSALCVWTSLGWRDATSPLE